MDPLDEIPNVATFFFGGGLRVRVSLVLLLVDFCLFILFNLESGSTAEQPELASKIRC